MSRRLWAIALFTGLSCLLAAPSWADGDRTSVALDQVLRFHRGDAPEAEQIAFDDSAWVAVRLPHTWNGVDGEDGGSYYRGPGWYRVSFTRPNQGRRLWLEFDGAALVADAWVNGVHVGRHEGGYARFRFDVTDAARPGENVLAVRVDNSAAPHIAPLGGDFTIFGGLYRAVRLVAVDPLHIDLADYGGPGVYMTASNVSADAADLAFVVRFANDSNRRQRLRVRTTVTDSDGARVLSLETPSVLAPGVRGEVRQSARLPEPRLWDGRANPHLYWLTAEIIDARGSVTDSVTVQTGVRAATFDPEQGFFLNGRAHSLYGVNYQVSGRPGRGTAVHAFEIDQDFEIMNDLGVTAIRFAHMQHGPRAYELADALGLAVWTEAPLVSAANASPAFTENLAQQMRELIRQTQNHPSVVVWGLGNEVYAADDAVNDAIALMQSVAKDEDASRATVYAHCCQDDLHRIALNADLGAYNRYFGWYDGEMARIGDWADELHARAPARAFAVSEYGAGASVLHQRDPPDRPRPDGPWHPEQYQTAFHETYWRALRERPYVWGNFVWLAFDFASDGRNEGDRAGINDKGLVTYDRAVRKDAYYWYQANWSDAPMAHILNRRIEITSDRVTVRAYTNQDMLRLSVDGRDIGSAAVVDHVVEWRGVALSPGLNRVQVRAPSGATDIVYWRSP